MIIDINPIAKPRMTRSDSWKKRPCVLKYRAWKDEIKLKSNGFKIVNNLYVDFGIEMPKSWSKKKRKEMLGEYHQQKPDIDNLLKAVLDSPLVDGCDSKVSKVFARKFWAEKGYISIISY